MASNNSRQIIYKNGIPVPIHIIRELRKNSRISLLKDKVNIRIPRHLNKEKGKEQILDLLKWAEKRISKDEYYHNQIIDYDNFNRIYTILDKEYNIKLSKSPKKSFKTLIKDDNIYVIIPDFFITPAAFDLSVLRRKATYGLLKIFEEEFKEEVFEQYKYARRFIKHQLTNIRFAYTSSKWGSCHANGEIQLSARLLFAPKWVRRYVILHELAHLDHMNHSTKFWRLVEEMCPEYKEAKNYLKTHEKSIDF